MNTYLVSYDLGIPETHESYSLLSEQIKKTCSSWARPLKSVWIIKSNNTAAQVRDQIKTPLDSNDRLIVMQIGGNWATYNISKEVTEWMKNNF